MGSGDAAEKECCMSPSLPTFAKTKIAKVGHPRDSSMNKRSEVESKSSEELIRLYEKAAHDHRQATDSGDPKTGNKAADVVAAIYHELRNRGLAAQSLLLPLLNRSDSGVRAWTAAHALEFAPEKGEPVLEALSNEPRLLGFSAKMTLKVWREGRLKFP
jgi:hypothetical protein